MTKYVAHIPNQDGLIDYGADEHGIWQDLMTRQASNLPNKACQDYLDGLAKLNLPIDRLPQLPDIDAILQKQTGWKTAPVPALISFRRFFKLLESKQFPVATFIRTREDFDYIQEPDIFHEIAGHCPMLTHPAFAEFTRIYGKLGVDASKQERVFLARLYWFTVEFGLINTKDGVRIYGGGILSSPAETNYALSDKPEHRAFDILDVLRTPYRIDRVQPIYYVIDNIDTLYEVAQSDILTKVHEAMNLGLYELHPSLKDSA